MVTTSDSEVYRQAPPDSEPPSQGDRQVRLDQLKVAHHSTAIALPVNMLLSIVCALVAWHSGQHLAALLWLAASALVNGGRALAQFAPRARLRDLARHPMASEEVERHLGILWKTTLLSGGVWALLPLLCALYTAPESLFFLIVGCGITAGAVSHGAAYARVPIAFIVPPILTTIAAMVYVGGYARDALAVTMLIYLIALVVTARRAEMGFREASRMTQRVVAMNASLETANQRALMLAERMRHRADHDELTGLRNRAGFLREAAARSGGAPSCMMLLDLDGFKAINDAFGHQIGDEILLEVADRLRGALPPEVTIGRWGGDEFAVLCPSGAAIADPVTLANQLIVIVSAPYTAFGTIARVGLSIGIHLGEGTDMAERLSCADLALYAAKAGGRNRCYVFDEDLRHQLDIRRDIERDLPASLVDGSIQMWFQPIFGARGETVCSLEALIRWHHPVHGWIPPPDLMAIAARAGFAGALMELILDRVCLMILALRDRQLDHISVAMNVSPREMSQLPVDDMILAALAARRLSPMALEIEITEETALDIAHSERKLAALSRAGIRIAIDDFGVGYSSLSSLRRLNVDRIKIDRCFVSGLTGSDGDQVVVNAVLHLGRSLRIDVIAEGVESAEDVRTLGILGCHFMQGYHLARPMRVDDCLAFLTAAPMPQEPIPFVPEAHRLAG